MLIYYVVFFFLILRFAVTLFNFLSNPKLTATARTYADLVSVLIPARNEEGNILRLLESISSQDYQNLEVVVLDDSSSDSTYEQCSRFAERDSRFQVIKGKELPEGWLGKNYACHQLARQAKGKYLLFLDADTTVSSGLINNAVHRIKLGRLSLLSLFANQVMQSPGERLAVPLMHFLLLNLLPLRLVKLSRNAAFAAASGQCMLFDAAIYHQEEWHQKVKDRVVEDIEIMKQVKSLGYSGEALLANGYVYCRMYKGFREAVVGFSKNLLAGFSNNVPALVCYLLLVMVGPLFVALYLDLQLFLFMVTLVVLSRLMISLLSGQNPFWNIILHPIQMLSLLLLSVVSVRRNLTNTVTWKGRRVER